MKRYLSFCMLGIATMLASCSQNEELLQGVDNNNSNTVTFSVALDEGMKTRAFAEDPAVSTMDLRAILLEEPANEQGEPTSKEITAITPNGDGTFAVTVSGMMTNSKYKLVLWADNGSDYTVENNVATLANASKPGIAFYGTSGEYQTPDELSAKASNTLELTHAVAKVTLNTTTALTDGKIATLSVPTRTSFNLISGEATGDGTAIDTSEGVTSGNLCSVYVLCNDDDDLPTATIALSNGQEKEIASLPMKRNNHIKLQGDVDGIRTAGSLDFKVYLDEKWNETDKIFLPAKVDETTHTITTYIAGQIAAVPEVIAKTVGTGSELKIEGPMNSNDFAALKKYLINDANTELSINLTAVTELTEIPNNAFSECTNLSSVQLSDNITRIGAGAFSGCTNLTTVNMPQNLISMGAGAFYESGLSGEIELPEGFTTFDPFNADNPGMQFDYTQITALTLPESLGDITVNTIRCYNCDELKTVTFKSTVKKLFYGAFGNSPNLTDVYMLGNATEAPIFPDFLFEDKTKVTIHVPQGALSYFSSLIDEKYNIVEITE
ncbi:MAG: leucine-rich repeat domain-containing protein [Bacteroidales bacterium]|nr:leucine-rich repeat domain-containing protein [Bacteroidales bacterium]